MQYQTLINAYSPVLFFHPNEQYYPCSIEYYFKHSTLQDSDNNIVSATPLTPQNICSYDVAEMEKTFLKIDKSAWEGPNNILNTPMYVSVAETINTYILKYIFLYAYNGSYKLGSFNIGGHDCDIEHITIHVSKNLHTITEIFYSAHGTADGMWVSSANIEFTGSHPNVYIARGSHATYPTAGIYYRIFGLANDFTRNDGFVLKPVNVVLINDITVWNCFSTVNCKAPKFHAWWEVENGLSTTWLKRILHV
jgi:hypothetical protein